MYLTGVIFKLQAAAFSLLNIKRVWAVRALVFGMTKLKNYYILYCSFIFLEFYFCYSCLLKVLMVILIVIYGYRFIYGYRLSDIYHYITLK